jgi:hypothetical protein
MIGIMLEIVEEELFSMEMGSATGQLTRRGEFKCACE